MSREITVQADDLADLVEALYKMLKELKKMNMYLALMNDMELTNEDIEG